MFPMSLVLLSLICLFGMTSSLAAQTKSVADLANYRGVDREEMLKAGARNEGKLVWYTSLTAHRDIANVFESKISRHQSGDLSRRSHGSLKKTFD